MVDVDAGDGLRDDVEAREKEAGKDACESLLTDRQVEVLTLRLQGLSQQEVAEILGTTRSNVSILEKRAHQNVARARRTLQQWMAIQAPVSLVVPAGTDVFDLPDMIFAAADGKSIQLPVTSLDIVGQLRQKAPKLFKKRFIPVDVQIYVTARGEILIPGLNSLEPGLENE